jgi:hypothetical protein
VGASITGSGRSRARAAYFKRYNAKKGRRSSKSERAGERLVLGIDGEGYSLPDGSHRYVYMAACSKAGLHSELRNKKGLTADQVFAWLVTLPRKALLVGFALGYDRTKWVESWPDERVWRLMRPDERLGKTGPLPVDCEGWRVNLVATRTTVRRKDDPDESRTVWDVWKFFQSSFVKALARWDVGSLRERRFIAKQKDRRGDFAGIGKTEERYCQLECSLLADLTSRMLQAHVDAGIKLKAYYGPGSSSAVVLEEMGADRQKARVPERMAHAVDCAYFGGRFEVSRVGPVKAKRLYYYDIASAYPHAFTRLPCLVPRHGHWVRRKDGNLKGRHPTATCVRFEVRPHGKAHPAWGPLPHRTPKGDILFPLESAGGWAWLPEFRAAKKLHPGVTALETWSWRPDCDCGPPFAARVRELYYLRRDQWGRTARGIVLKFLLNSLYGKSAQRAGKGRFRCMVRAGLVTAMTRARLLLAVSSARGPWDVLELATDSVLSLRPIASLKAVKDKPDLGGWEEKPWPGGVFLMRPGVRFPLRLVRTKKEKAAVADQTAARGLGTKTLASNRRKVMRKWERAPMAPVKLPTPSFFHGAKLAVRSNRAKDEWSRDALYGCWTAETRTVSYKPTPKRCAVLPDFKLEPWRLPRGTGCESVPYSKTKQSAIGDELDRMRELQDDQPDQQSVAIV